MALIGTLTSGVSALRTFSSGLEVIGNNIANINTTGYKSNQVSYADSFSNTLSASSQSAMQIGTGVQLSAVSTNFTQGALNSTGNTTDVAISGNGFFVVEDPTTGAQYATRDGSFSVDANGFLVTQSGMRVQGLVGGSTTTALGTTVGDIAIGQSLPAGAELDSVSIDSSGNIVEFYSDGTSATTNRLQLQNFSNTASLVKEGNNLYSGLDSAGPIGGSILAGSNDPTTNGLGKIVSGSLEQSNVDLTQQFSDLITTQRSFQAGSRLITVSDTVLEDIVNLKRS